MGVWLQAWMSIRHSPVQHYLQASFIAVCGHFVILSFATIVFVIRHWICGASFASCAYLEQTSILPPFSAPFFSKQKVARIFLWTFLFFIYNYLRDHANNTRNHKQPAIIMLITIEITTLETCHLETVRFQNICFCESILFCRYLRLSFMGSALILVEPLVIMIITVEGYCNHYDVPVLSN